MTLNSFQKVTKATIVVVFLVLFAFANYTIGKVTADTKGPQVKGVSDKNEKQVIEKPLPYADVQSGEVISSQIKLCSNASLGFEIAYPADWFTTYNLPEQKCTFFAPFSFVVPESADKDFVPIAVELINPDEWLGTQKFYENPNDFYNVVSAQNLDVEGKLVEKIVLKTTGAGDMPRGYTQVHYLIFDAQKPVRISYQQLEESDDVPKLSETLEDLVKSLKYF